MAEKFYTVLENQLRTDGSYGLLYDHFYGDGAEDRAKAKFHTVMAAAYVSDIPYHSCHVLRSDGIVTMGEIVDRRTGDVDG